MGKGLDIVLYGRESISLRVARQGLSNLQTETAMPSSTRRLLLMSLLLLPECLRMARTSPRRINAAGVAPTARGSINQSQLPEFSRRQQQKCCRRTSEKYQERSRKAYDLASQLKTKSKKTDSTTVLSLAMVKKAEEIEKLAKQIKDHAKG